MSRCYRVPALEGSPELPKFSMIVIPQQYVIFGGSVQYRALGMFFHVYLSNAPNVPQLFRSMFEMIQSEFHTNPSGNQCRDASARGFVVWP